MQFELPGGVVAPVPPPGEEESGREPDDEVPGNVCVTVAVATVIYSVTVFGIGHTQIDPLIVYWKVDALGAARSDELLVDAAAVGTYSMVVVTVPSVMVEVSVGTGV